MQPDRPDGGSATRGALGQFGVFGPLDHRRRVLEAVVRTRGDL